MDTNKVAKLTSFSACYKGKHVQRFIYCAYVNDKAVMSMQTLNAILEEEFGIVPKGATFTIG